MEIIFHLALHQNIALLQVLQLNLQKQIGGVLADGAAIGLHGLIDYSAGNVSYPYGYMYVDINGAKGPNIVGRDFFLFYYFNDGTLDDVVTPECKTAGICSSTLEVQRVNYSCVGQTWPAGCLGRILNDNWQMTY